MERFDELQGLTPDAPQLFAALLELALASDREQLPALLGRLEQAKAIAFARLTCPSPGTQADKLVSVREAAQRLSICPSYIYHHTRDFPFLRRVGRRLLASSHGIDRYICKLS